MQTPFTLAGNAMRGAMLGALVTVGVAAPFAASAQRVLWADDAQLPASARPAAEALRQYRLVRIEPANLRATLATAPAEGTAAALQSGTVVSLPLPDGTSGRFRLTETAVMHPQLAAKYPSIKTYAGQGIDDPSARAYVDMEPAGLHAMIRSTNNTVFIDPTPDGLHHLVFNRRDINRSKLQGFNCLNTDESAVSGILAPFQSGSGTALRASGTQLRTYRLAVACTGEYAVAVAGANPTKPAVLAKIVTSVNRVKGVYETEQAVSFQLIANNDALIYLDANTDPYTNLSGSTMLGQNQTTVTNIIGSANFDVGHVFSTGGGGIANKGCICDNSRKAMGVTGLANPQGDAFDIDYVAHEVGHQFGASHTFNYDGGGSCTSGTRSSSTAYEPGGGTTIMAYAGICPGGDLQNNSDPYFHSASYQEIQIQVNGTGCAAITATNNNPPVVNAGPSYIIPISTPFELTGSATDPDGDALTYCWEEYDLGPAGAPNLPVAAAPIFRSFLPTTNPTRTFPATERRVNNTLVPGPLLTNVPVTGERLPTYARFLRFRLTARDNKPTGGGVDYATTTLQVSAVGGPFEVTAPNTSSVIWRAGASQLVSWDVANTTAAPISAANVDILLSIDGGRTFPYTLLAGTPNDGSEVISLPTTIPATSQARVKVKASGNIFFDLSNQDFQIQVPTAPTFFLTSTCSGSRISICPGTSGTCAIQVGPLLGFTGSVSLAATGLPTGATATFAPTPTPAGSTTTLTINTASTSPSGTYNVTITGTSGGQTETTTLTLVLRNSAAVPPTLQTPAANTLRAQPRPQFTWTPITGATSYDLEVSTSATFAAGATVITQTGLTTTSYTPTTALSLNTQYYWRVRATAECGTGPYQTGAFAVGNPICTQYAATTVPATIGTTANAVATSTVAVSATTPIQSVRVSNLSITHPDVFELGVKLIGPDGSTQSELYANTCSGANLSGTFDDNAAGSIACPATGTGTYKPNTPLSVFSNATPTGNWTLQVTDLLAGNGGTLNSWTLELCTLGDAVLANRAAQQLQGVSVFPNPSTGQFELRVDNAQTGELSVRVTDAVGRVVLSEQLRKGSGQLQHRLNLSQLSQGVYQLHLDLPGGGTAVQKLMKL